MIDERHHTERAMAAGKQRFANAVVFKHADRSTTGIPDWTMSLYGSTFWIEDKYLRTGDKLHDIVPVQQLSTCHQLHSATEGKCWVFVYEQNPKQLTIWVPRNLFMHLWPKFAGPEIGRKDLGCTPLNASEGIEALTVPLNVLLQQHGAVRIPGWPYAAAAQLIEDYLREQA
jgi:hypothetical protein